MPSITKKSRNLGILLDRLLAIAEDGRGVRFRFEIDVDPEENEEEVVRIVGSSDDFDDDEDDFDDEDEDEDEDVQIVLRRERAHACLTRVVMFQRAAQRALTKAIREMFYEAPSRVRKDAPGWLEDLAHDQPFAAVMTTYRTLAEEVFRPDGTTDREMAAFLHDEGDRLGALAFPALLRAALEDAYMARDMDKAGDLTLEQWIGWYLIDDDDITPEKIMEANFTRSPMDLWQAVVALRSATMGELPTSWVTVIDPFLARGYRDHREEQGAQDGA